MAKEYTTKDGRKIIGWYRRGGKAIPILEGQVKKGEGHANGEFGTSGVVGFTKKNRGDKLKRPVNISKKDAEESVKMAREQTAKRYKELHTAPKKQSEIREEARLKREKENGTPKYSKKDDPDYISSDGVRYRTKREARLASNRWDNKRFEEELKDNKDKIKLPIFDYSGDGDSWFNSANRREYEVDGAFVDENKRVHLYNDGKWEMLPEHHEVDGLVPNSWSHTNWGGGEKDGNAKIMGEYYYPKSVYKAKKKAEKEGKQAKSEKEDLLERSRKGQLTPKEMTDPETRKKMYGDTIGMLREMGNANMRHSMMQTTEKDINKYMNASNKFEDAARQFEGKRPIVSLAREKIGEAHIHADEVTKDLQDSLKNDAGSVDRGLPFRVKGEESMHRKIREKAWKKQIQPEEYAKKVTDALRFTDMVDGDNFVKSFKNMKKGLKERGYDMVEVENTIHKEGEAYRGVNTLVTSPKGYTFELQFHTPQSFDIKEENHKDYNVERRASTPPAVSKALQEQMKQRSRSVETPEGASKIRNVKRRPSRGPSEDAIRGMMKRKGVDRITAIKYLKAINK